MAISEYESELHDKTVKENYKVIEIIRDKDDEENGEFVS
jgi:hypothetical protein